MHPLLLPLALVCSILAAPALSGSAVPRVVAGDENPRKDPAKAEPGKVYQWESADGLPFEYRLPEDYDPEVGASVTMVLHGNGLDHRWTFWNHPPDSFRTADIVVSPDGTTPHKGTGANEFLQGAGDIARVEALLLELKETWNIQQVFLYGHSQGAFFVYWFAGAKPDLVDGVVAHAGGVWIGTEAGKKGHGIAIGVLHGTEDHVPYAQGVGGRTFYEERKYPNVHLRTLFGWDHRPHWHQASQVLAWCEGMTSQDPARVLASAEECADTRRPMGVDWAALHDIAERLAGMEEADEDQRARGRELADAVSELAAEHLEAIEKGAGKEGFRRLSGGPWAGELLRFDEVFRGTPAWHRLHEDHQRTLEKLVEVGSDLREDFWKEASGGDAKALEHLADWIEEGYLASGLDRAIDRGMALLEGDETKVKRKLERRVLDAIELWEEARSKGAKSFMDRNGKFKLPS